MAEQLRTPNAIYKHFVGEKIVPFSDFIEIENRRYKASKEETPFVKWMNDRYRLIGRKAWFNTETSRLLKDLGYESDYTNITAEKIQRGADSASSIANSISQVAGALKKQPQQQAQPSNNYTPTTKKKGLSGGAIAGIVLGSVTVLGLLTFAIVKSQK